MAMDQQTHRRAQLARSNSVDATSPGNWRPWQISPFLLFPLILVAAVLAAAIEVFTSVSNRQVDESEFISMWKTWAFDDDGSAAGDGLDDIPCLNVSSNKRGFLTFEGSQSIPTSYYFLWLYFPSILAVVYAMVWQIVDSEVKRMEPFYQASRPGGANPDSTLFGDYISWPPFCSPVQALRWRHWAVLLSSSIYVLVGVVTPILQSQMFQTQSQMFQIGYLDEEYNLFEPFTKNSSSANVDIVKSDDSLVGIFSDEFSETYNGGVASVHDLFDGTEGMYRNVAYMDPVVSRVQEAVLIAVVILGLLSSWLLLRRPSGMRDPMHGLAVTASHANVDRDFLKTLAFMVDAVDPRAGSNKKVHLGWMESEIGLAYGFWFSEDINSGPTGPTTKTSFAVPQQRQRKPKEQFLAFRCSLLFSFIGFFPLLITVLTWGDWQKGEQYRLDNQKISSDDIAIPAVMLTLSALIKALWKAVERGTMTLSVFRSLHTKPQKAWPLLARDYTALPPFEVTLRAILDRQYFVAFVTMVSLFLEIALICFGIIASMVRGPAYREQDMYNSTCIALAMSATMFISVPFFRTFMLKSIPWLDRKPATIGAQLSYVCHSGQLLEDVRPLTIITDRHSQKNYLRDLDELYGFGPICRYEPATSIPGSHVFRGYAQGFERSDLLNQTPGQGNP